jgi:hypothetical protein
MSLAGLITEYLFKALGWVPTSRPTVIAGDTVRFDYTTVLDIIAFVAFAGMYWLYRNRERPIHREGNQASTPKAPVIQGVTVSRWSSRYRCGVA